MDDHGEQQSEHLAAEPTITDDALTTQTAPALPAYPATTPTDTAPAQAQPDAAPEQAPTPTYPGTVGYPPYPVIPGYSNAPSAPLYQNPASAPLYQTLPGYPSAPSAPYYQNAPTMGGYYAPPFGQPAPETRRLPREESALAKPFQLWLTILVPVVMLFTLVIVGAASLVFGADWASAAVNAAVVALVLALIIVVMFIVRFALGRRAMSTVGLTALLAVALIGSGIGGIVGQPALRTAQAQQLEAANKWQAAITEYQRNDEVAPNAPDVARVYTEWGEELAKQGDNAGAVSKLNIVNESYLRSGAIVERARADLYTIYVAWIRSGQNGVPYEQAVTYLTGYATDSACSATCQSTIGDVSAQAYYQYGVQLASASQYQQAITEFEIVQAQYPTSPYAKQAHSAAAAAYLTLATSEQAQSCESSVPLYQTLAKKYGDTAQGQQAQGKLNAPVKVTIALTGAPQNPPPVMFLSRQGNWNANYFSEDYSAYTGANEVYTFGSVKPGAYFITSVRTTYAYIYTVEYLPSSSTQQFTVTPVCANNFGSYNYPSGS